MRHRLARFLPALCGLVGCFTPLADEVQSTGLRLQSPRMRATLVDNEASEVTAAPDATGQNWRSAISGAIQSAVGPHEVGRPAIRYRVTRLDSHGHFVTAWLPCFFILTVLGCPQGGATTEIEIEVQAADRVKTVQGTGSGVLTVYTARDGFAHYPFLAEAIVDALGKLDEEDGWSRPPRPPGSAETADVIEAPR